MRARSFGPGRVNLIGDHTDYTGGYVLPMAIEMGTTVEVVLGGSTVHLVSESEADPAVVDVHLDGAAAAHTEPPWARYVAGVVATTAPAQGATGTVTSTLPIGAGLSSSAALEVSVALALGFDGTPIELARACQRAEHVAAGVPSGIMDQLASAAGVAGHALLIDCTTLELSPVPVPDNVEFAVVHSGQTRTLAGSAYAERRDECQRAVDAVGPLREATLADLDLIDDAVVRRRARHVVTENQRVLDFARHLRAGDLRAAGAVMTASHASLRDDFEVSTPALERVVSELARTRGVYGARLTGAGFGGCAVALIAPGTEVGGWRLHPSAGATVERW